MLLVVLARFRAHSGNQNESSSEEGGQRQRQSFTQNTATRELLGKGEKEMAMGSYILTVPFMEFVLPYFLGVALIRRGGQAGRDGQAH